VQEFQHLEAPLPDGIVLLFRFTLDNIAELSP
jgi:hypothetical protein